MGTIQERLDARRAELTDNPPTTLPELLIGHLRLALTDYLTGLDSEDDAFDLDGHMNRIAHSLTSDLHLELLIDRSLTERELASLTIFTEQLASHFRRD